MNGTGYQFWISDDDFFLPVKMVLVYGGEKSSPQFEAIYSDWSLNPNLPDGMFQSAVPPKAIEVKSKKEK